MKKFVTLTKEEVLVEDFTCQDTHVKIHYKKGIYERSVDVFGTKLFPMDKTAKKYLKDTLNVDVEVNGYQNKKSKKAGNIPSGIKIGDTVKLKDYKTKENLTVKIVGVHQNKTYRRMGGSYYGNSVSISYVGDELGERNGIQNISCECAMGKKLLGKYCGDIVVVEPPDGKKYKVEIIGVNNKSK